MNLENEHVNVTDSHRALQVNYPFISENKLIDPKTENEYKTDRVYPDINRFFPCKDSASNKLALTKEDIFIIHGILKQLKCFKVVKVNLMLNQQNKTYELSFDKNEKENDSLKNLNCQYNISVENNENSPKKITLNIKYLLDALDFCKDDMKENNTENYYIYLYSSIHPILISNDAESFKYLLLPIRTSY